MLTSFLSGALLSALFSLITLKDDGVALSVHLGTALMMGLGGLIFGALAWLPLMILWNAVLFRLGHRFALRPLAASLSAAMAFVLTAAASSVTFGGGDWPGVRQVAIFGGWILGTTGLAWSLTLCAFGATEELKP
ncbi:hypothetical protein [Stagnihabitans tardus]|uniref:Uncharacterized protein n=1 Tax=Stagnihabitans tardus TaxID=2699202 RepID=A0AAE4YAS0_9RHOB|nr:hypothetical protein [Stagnihabitans tardus]NBZ86160.1 hypothetical protein [Stagnihabitans tardus]